MEIVLCAKLVSSSGLILDIVGACFVGWEVVNQFKGQKTTITTHVKQPPSIGRNMDDDPPNPVVKSTTSETKEFKKWDTVRYNRMKIGLCFLVAGFLLQIAGIWMN